jgi:hypothetical protein
VDRHHQPVNWVAEIPEWIAILQPLNWIAEIPKGLLSFSPALRGTSYAGSSFKQIINPERVESIHAAIARKNSGAYGVLDERTPTFLARQSSS